jgi:hypothetical protein
VASADFHDMQPRSFRNASLWLIFLAAALTAVAFFFIPAFIIRPFHHQTPSALALAMSLRQRAPWATLAAGLVSVLFALILWPNVSRLRKIILAIAMVVVAFSAVMSRLNYFEWMFHPVDSPQFDSASASKLDKGEMIMAIRYGSDARAYPIREMAYHHVLNDVVSGVPVAVTY